MKIQNVTNVNEFFELVNKCKGSVELVSRDGDRLNLKSKLTQYVSLANIFSSERMIKEIDLIVSEPEDVQRFVNYMMYRKIN